MKTTGYFILPLRESPEITAKDGKVKIFFLLPNIAEFSGYHKIEDTTNSPFTALSLRNGLVGDWLNDEFEEKLVSRSNTRYHNKRAINGKTWHYAIGGTPLPKRHLDTSYWLRVRHKRTRRADFNFCTGFDRQWLSAGLPPTSIQHLM